MRSRLCATVQRPSVRPSVCLSVPSFVGRTPLLRGCAAERRAADIDRLLSSTALGSKRGQ